MSTRHVGAILGALAFAQSAAGQFTQQGNKLVGTGAVGTPQQGYSVALSADGNTAVVGGFADNSYAGAAWVWTRSGGVWTQQGSKLVGTGAVGAAAQGCAVALSGDGNTAIVGGYGDNSSYGAAWAYTRNGGVWTQQGSKLVGTGAVGSGEQGLSVALSADGNTAVVGVYQDNSNVGAAWVWTRSSGVWTQQGSKWVGTGAVGHAVQGASVALSADGNTAIVGGPGDNSVAGAAWVWTRSGGVWTQQGSKLVGNGAVGEASQGWSVALSGDGNTAIVGGFSDDFYFGAAWVWTRSGGVWTQQGSKLVGTDAVGGAAPGYSVAICGDATTILVGLPGDNSDLGAAWIFVASPSYPYWIPVASHNSGLNQSQWRSDLGLLNTGTAQANVQLSFYGSSTVTNTSYVPAGSQSILTDVVGQLGGTGSGAIQVISDQPLKATARSYNQVSSGAACYANGTQGQDYPVLSNANGLSTGQIAYLASLTENASYRSNIGLVNTSTASASVLVELFDGAGNKLTGYTVSLTPGQWSQATQPFMNLAGQTAMDRGFAKLTVQSGSGIFGFASVIDNITNDPTTVTMQQ
jgi:hypothetical protein